MKTPLLVFLAAIAALTTPALAQWPEFRGPNRDGTVDSAKLPTEWSEEKNVTWKKAIHGLGWSTPIISEGKIWLTTATEDGHRMSILCLDEKTGETLLDRVFITSDNPEPLSNPMNTYASPSGVAEPERVYLHFGSYGTFCLDTESCETIWRRDRSTRFNDGLLFMANGGVVSAVDITNGEIAWAERGGGEYSASSITDGKHVYHFDEEGLCTVLKAAREFEVVAENHLDGGFMASPAVTADGALILRTKTHLYRVE
jgi:outer membrane protein assembly factor BamB